jgi:hypothetical protein
VPIGDQSQLVRASLYPVPFGSLTLNLTPILMFLHWGTFACGSGCDKMVPLFVRQWRMVCDVRVRCACACACAFMIYVRFTVISDARETDGMDHGVPGKSKVLSSMGHYGHVWPGRGAGMPWRGWCRAVIYIYTS